MKANYRLESLVKEGHIEFDQFQHRQRKRRKVECYATPRRYSSDRPYRPPRRRRPVDVG